ERAGIEAGRRGVRVDERLRSVSDAHVWAAGDAADRGLPLTPVASKEGKVVAAGILGEDAAYDGRAVPSVCFSDPPLAAVGMSAAEAARQGDAVKVLRADSGEWFSQRRIGQTHGGMALVTDAASGRLLGGHLLGVDADEVINVLALAIRHGLTASDLTAMTWSYPTATADLPYVLG
ncbi:MAG TPA: NAD(P)/FAD-dependent oxidoreductase, partial [Thermoleophilia bacterium]